MRGVGSPGIGADRHKNVGGERTEADRAEIHVEIFELRGPVSADPAFDAGARGPTDAGRVKTGENSSTRPLRSLSGDATGCVHFAVGETAGSVEQHGRSDQNAGA